MKRKSKLEKITPVIMGVCMLTFVAACGSDDDSSSSAVPQQEEEQQQQQGDYQITLTPLNPNVSGSISGSGTFIIAEDSFGANLNVAEAREGIHLQNIRLGRACPTPSSDTNGDGYVDAVEATSISGQVLIPLDDDLESQSAGGSYRSGANYVYAEVASFSRMLADLQAVDDNPTDIVAKLPQGEGLNLEGRVVVIHGVPASTTLPPTVQGESGAGPQQVLPIACGVITRSATTSGTTTGGTTTGGTTTGGTTTGGTTTGGTTTGGTTTGGTTTGGTTTDGTTTGGTTTDGTTTDGTTTGI